MDLAHILAYALGVLSGVVAALKVIAPLTKTTVDDKVLGYAEKAEDVLQNLPVKPATPDAPAPAK